MHERDRSSEAAGRRLSGRRLLLAKADFFNADILANALCAAGADILGPVPSAEDARRLIERFGLPEGAILGTQLRDGNAFNFATEMRRRAVPVVFLNVASGLGCPIELADVPMMSPASNAQEIGRALFG